MPVTPTYPAPANPAAPVKVPATTGTRVTVYAVATGEALSRWPVDARELVASGEYSMTPPVAAPVAAAPEAAPEAPTDPAPALLPAGEAMAVEAATPPAAAASPAVPGGDALPPKRRGRPRKGGA